MGPISIIAAIIQYEQNLSISQKLSLIFSIDLALMALAILSLSLLSIAIIMATTSFLVTKVMNLFKSNTNAN